MEQLDLFEETAYKKLMRLERWMVRIQKQMICIQDDLYLTKSAIRSKEETVATETARRGIVISRKTPQQLTFFLN